MKLYLFNIILVIIAIYYLAKNISTPLSYSTFNEGFSGITQKSFFLPVVILSSVAFFVLCVIIYYTYLGAKTVNKSLKPHSNIEGLKSLSRFMGEKAIENKVPFRVYLPFILIAFLAVIIGVIASTKK